MILTIATLKGGTGKTTTAMHLARLLSDTTRVNVLDVDPQGSATEWALTAPALAFDVHAANIRTLKALEKTTHMGDHAAHIVIDTPPGSPDIIRTAAKISDMVIVPAEASAMDLLQVVETFSIIGDVPAAFLLTKAMPFTTSYKDAREALTNQNIPVFTQAIRRRESIKKSYGTAIVPDIMYSIVLEELISALGGRI